MFERMSESVSKSQPGYTLQPGIPVMVIMLLIFFVIYSKSLYPIVVEWMESGPYNHGFLAFLIAGYLGWEKRAAFSQLTTRINWIPVLFAVGSGFGWWISKIVNVQLGQLLSLFFMMCALIAVVYGHRSLFGLKAPLFVLLLVLPVWDRLSPSLQRLSSEVSHAVLYVLGIPVFREGFHFTVPGGQFVVEEGCSGLGFLLSSLLLGFLYGHFNNLTNVNRFKVMLLAAAFAIFSNWVRISLIMVIGNYTRMENVVVHDHLMFGWFVFAFMLIPFFVSAHYLFPPVPEAATAAGTVSNESTKWRVSGAMLVTALVAALIFPAIDAAQTRSSFDVVSADSVPDQISGLLTASADQAAMQWKPYFSGASSREMTRYTYKDRELICLVVQYNFQEQGRELVHVENALVSDDLWTIYHSDVSEVEIGERRMSLRTHRVNGKDGSRRTLVDWYMIGGRVTASPVVAKLYELMGAFKGDRRAYLIALATDGQTEASHQYLLELAALIQNHLET